MNIALATISATTRKFGAARLTWAAWNIWSDIVGDRSRWCGGVLRQNRKSGHGREGLFERRFVYSRIAAISISEIANLIDGMKKMTHMQGQTASNEREVNE
ncbi:MULTISPECIES: hypothetical protein [unclassified Rhizobium]|uniref:hypothetical protein n=1 Tax=unclassified Rhizobium TaxID=2613769 RepID=UPI0016011633|nr:MULTISPECIES: hypothetical protein [unclassified Rhizobium]MBN8949371.1 hypothetical protein [Rhizobium tropici]